MVLKTFWGSLGLLLGALGGFLGGSWELFGASRTTKEGLQVRLGTLLGLVCLPRAAGGGLGKVLGSSLACFIRSRNLLGSILSSQADPPTLKKLDFASAGARFLTNPHFRSKDGFGSVLGLSWAAFGCSWSLLWVLSGSLWVLLGAAWAPGGPLRLQLGALRVSLRTPKRFQNHLWIENNDFSKIELPPA